MSGAQGVLLSPQWGCASPMPPIASALTLQHPHHAVGIQRAYQVLAKAHGAAGIGVCSRATSFAAAGCSWRHAAIQHPATHAFSSQVVGGCVLGALPSCARHRDKCSNVSMPAHWRKLKLPPRRGPAHSGASRCR